MMKLGEHEFKWIFHLTRLIYLNSVIKIWRHRHNYFSSWNFNDFLPFVCWGDHDPEAPDYHLNIVFIRFLDGAGQEGANKANHFSQRTTKRDKKNIIFGCCRRLCTRFRWTNRKMCFIANRFRTATDDSLLWCDTIWSPIGRFSHSLFVSIFFMILLTIRNKLHFRIVFTVSRATLDQWTL